MPVIIRGVDASPDPPAAVDTIPAGKPKKPGRGADANDGGALWWDHDDPGQQGAAGDPGDTGYGGVPGAAGGSTPYGASVIINQAINGSFPILIIGGRGQPGGQGGKGGTGGEG